MDAVHEIDWAARWRARVEAREALLGPGGEGFWDRQAALFQARTRAWAQGGADPFLQVIEPWVRPTRTLIDVGGGYGRHAVPLADRLEWVTLVEPSAGMRARIPDVDNMTVVASGWMEAEVQPADLVICANVLHPLADPVPFLEKLEAAATERVFVALRDSSLGHPADLIAGDALPREPWMRDCFNLLCQMGIAPDLTGWRVPIVYAFAGLEQAVEECRERLGPLWKEAEGRSWLETNLRQNAEGELVCEGGWLSSGALHWHPRERG